MQTTTVSLRVYSNCAKPDAMPFSSSGSARIKTTDIEAETVGIPMQKPNLFADDAIERLCRDVAANVCHAVVVNTYDATAANPDADAVAPDVVSETTDNHGMRAVTRNVGLHNSNAMHVAAVPPSRLPLAELGFSVQQTTVECCAKITETPQKTNHHFSTKSFTTPSLKFATPGVPSSGGLPDLLVDIDDSSAAVETMHAECRRLDEHLMSSGAPFDGGLEGFVRKIARSVLLNLGELTDCDAVKISMMTDEFYRLTIYEGEAVVVRINKFVNLSDTFVHNHTASFFSVVLRGAYNHKIFIEDGAADGSYFRYQRAKGGVMSGPFEEKGALQMTCGHTHGPGSVYFLHHCALHAVHDPMSVVTLTVGDLRGKCPSGSRWLSSSFNGKPAQSIEQVLARPALITPEKDSELSRHIVKDFKETFVEIERSFTAKSNAFSRLNAATAPRPVKALLASP